MSNQNLNQTISAPPGWTPPTIQAQSESDAYTLAALRGFNPQAVQSDPGAVAHPSVIPEHGGSSAGGMPAINPAMLAQANPALMMHRTPTPGYQVSDPGHQAPVGGYQAPPMGATAQLLKALYTGAPTEQPQDMPVPAGQDAANAGDPGKVLAKTEDKDGEDEDEDELEKKKRGAKSVTEHTLMKAARMVEAVSAGTAARTEEDERAFLAKSFQDGSLDEGGKTRLMELLQPDMPSDGGETMAKSFADLSQMDPDIQAGHTDPDGFDVSGYLARQSAFMGASLDNLAKAQNSDLVKAQGVLMVAMAGAMDRQDKLLDRQDKLLKAMATDIAALTTIAQPRRSAATAAALQKSLFHGTGAPGLDGSADDPFHGLASQQVSAGLAKMVHMYPNGMAPCGEMIRDATIASECGMGLSKAMSADIKDALARPLR